MGWNIKRFAVTYFCYNPHCILIMSKLNWLTSYSLSYMFHVKKLSREDFSFAVELANNMNWNMATEDFEFMVSLEPDGCFVLLDGVGRVGIATCVSYGEVGWFGNLVVKEEYRNKGAGSILLKHAVDYLHVKGVRTIGLYAYPHLVGFYGSWGFRSDGDFSVLHAERLGLIAARILPVVGRGQFSALGKFDSLCFGGDRRRLLQSIIFEEGNLSYYISEGAEIVGYVAATVYEKVAWVGPLICHASRRDVALLLVKAVLSRLGGKSIYMVVPKKDVILLEAFLSLGFREDFFVSRMFLGEPIGKNCIYLAESLERG